MSLKKGDKGLMALKIDLAKAYDRISWSFLEKTLCAARLPQDFIALVMACISTPSFQVMWNGGLTDSFKSSRGLRQGCPLSPYLFTLCIERLNHCIQEAIGSGAWKPISLGQGGTPLTHLFFADDLVLFAEATTNQGEAILHCLELFCSASGEQVSKQKSCVFFSKNTKDSTKKRINDMLGMKPTNNLGSYLGVPVIHGRVTKDTYKYILENIDKRISGGKARNLSLAGRVTLAMSVLNALPNYTMQTAVIPVSVCDLIDKKIRAFVWGAEQGKSHLVTWETICKPKEEGGLGLRSARALNLAYLMKLVWLFLNDESALWVKVLQGKYFKKALMGGLVMKKSRSSRLWKAMMEVWPAVKQSLIWDVRSGHNVNFWTSPWLSDGMILTDHVHSDGAGIRWEASVTELTTETGEWDWTVLQPHLPNELLNLIAGTDTPDPELGEDITTWGPEVDGRFRLKSAYKVVVEWLQNEEEDGANPTSPPKWKEIWKWKGPNRIVHFLWLVAHDRLLTNVERKRRKLTTDDRCCFCNAGPENAEHVVKNCPRAKQVWNILGIKDDYLTVAFPFADWLVKRLHSEKDGLLFGMTAWYLWKQRNESIFQHKTFDAEVLAQRIKSWTKIVEQAQESDRLTNDESTPKEVTSLAWEPPPAGWVSLQSDDSVRQPGALAATGGLIRDHLGRCLVAFSGNLGACTITRAEIKGVIEGLNRAWDYGYRKVMVGIDSTAALHLLTTTDQEDQRYLILIKQFQRLLNRNWEVKISHVYRECNKAADYLANRGHELSLEVHYFSISDSGLSFWVLYDCMGIAQTRLI
ncbi:unnamed protein product [Linum trigynum]|uniref:Reverse transcriptase domain-containing protein n=1 Tax=Linum trigynum TaxID=586398 RepID=A0AAV2FJG7_9ROSI